MAVPATRKAELQLITEQLRRSRTPDADAVRKWVATLLDDAKEGLVKADESNMLRSQGAARLLQEMHKALTVAPITVKE